VLFIPLSWLWGLRVGCTGGVCRSSWGGYGPAGAGSCRGEALLALTIAVPAMFCKSLAGMPASWSAETDQAMRDRIARSGVRSKPNGARDDAALHATFTNLPG